MMKKNLEEASSPGGVCVKGALENFTKLTRKHLCRKLIFHKVGG